MSPSHLLAGGRKLEYEWHGRGPGDAPTLVFLHEGLGSISMWRDFPARLAEVTGLGALVYSRAGYGGSDAVPLPRPLRFMHDEGLLVLPEVLDAAGVAEAVLVGHSDGGSIALIHAGSTRGSRVRALLLEAPHVFCEERQLDAIEAGCGASVERLVLPDCGHSPHRDQPDRTLAAMASCGPRAFPLARID